MAPFGPDPEKLPYPVAFLLERASQAHPEARIEPLLVAFERGLALTASILAAAYLRRLEQGGSRLSGVDKSLSPLHRPSLGGWVQVLRALRRHLPPDTHPVVPFVQAALPPGAIAATAKVVESRNNRFHRYNFLPETTDLIRAGSLAFLERLAGLGELRLVAVMPEGDWFDLQGLRPRRLEDPRCELEHPPAGPRILALANGDGPALNLSPLVLAGRATGTLVVDALLFHGRRKQGEPSHVGLGGEVVKDTRPDAAELAHELTLLLDPEAVAARHGPTELVEEPFRKLRVFEPWDAGLFFGRDQRVRDLAELVDESKLVVLHGASGTGKSSLLRAGLRPALDSTYL